jgi:predicted DNA-binding transcriptional regulator YafY
MPRNMSFMLTTEQIRKAMRDPASWVLRLRYKDNEGITTIRTVSPYRIDADSILVLCLAREECRRLKLSSCSEIELVSAADVLMPVAIEVVT